MPADIDSYVGREAAWHGLGIVTDRLLDPHEAKKLAFDWEPMAVPVIAGNTFDQIESHKAIARSDTGAVISVVNESYGILGNDVLTELAVTTGLQVETAGALGKGELVWMLLKMDSSDFGSGEIVDRYLWIATGHNAMQAMVARPTNVRVVCRNTWNAALDSTGEVQVSLKHTRHAANYVDAAKRVLAATYDQFVYMDEEIERLLNTPIREGEFEGDVIPLVLGPKPDDEGRALSYWMNRSDDLTTTYWSWTNEQIRGTAYGAIMAANEWELHFKPGRGQRAEMQVKRVLGGLPATAKVYRRYEPVRSQ